MSGAQFHDADDRRMLMNDGSVYQVAPPVRGRVYCTNPVHRCGEHDPSCIPSADPGNPELRLIRAVWGLCPDCDRTDDHSHEES